MLSNLSLRLSTPFLFLTGHVFENVGKDQPIYPSVGLRTQGESVRVNFGQEPFKYDIDRHMHEVQERVWAKIQATDVKWTIDESADVFSMEAAKNASEASSSGTTGAGNTVPQEESVKNESEAAKAVKEEPHDDDFVPLVLPPDYQEPLNKLILSYLTHHGYENTAQAFQSQAQAMQEQKAQLLRKPGSSSAKLNAKPDPSVDVKMEEDEDENIPRLSDIIRVDDGPFDLDELGTSTRGGVEKKGDDDFQMRQRIVNAVHAGDIDLAINLASEQCPQVLSRDDSLMYFKLRCRKFVELILLSSEANKKMQAASSAVDNNAEDVKEDSAMEVDDEGGQFASTPANGLANGATSSTTTKPDDRSHQPTNASASASTSALAAARSSYQAVLNTALVYGRKLQEDFKSDTRPEVQSLLKSTFSLVMYEDPAEVGGEVAEVASVAARNRLAQEMNQAILGEYSADPGVKGQYSRNVFSSLNIESQGRRSRPALERLYRQTGAVLTQLALRGFGEAAFVDMQKEFSED